MNTPSDNGQSVNPLTLAELADMREQLTHDNDPAALIAKRLWWEVDYLRSQREELRQGLRDLTAAFRRRGEGMYGDAIAKAEKLVGDSR